MIRILEYQFFKLWYWYISNVDKEANITYMNYGYSGNNMRISLRDEKDEKNRYSVQLYHYTVSPVDLKGKDILEIGCGRGGGLSYINRNLLPATSTGVDISHNAIQFCKDHYEDKNINFCRSCAQNLPFEDNSFDAVINVESSHRYPYIEKFLNEVSRVLKPGGYLLFADFRKNYKVKELESYFKNNGFAIESKEDITENVLEALNLSAPEREELIRKMAPRILRGVSRKFAATVGTPTYNKFLTRKFLYLKYVLRK